MTFFTLTAGNDTLDDAGLASLIDQAVDFVPPIGINAQAGDDNVTLNFVLNQTNAVINGEDGNDTLDIRGSGVSNFTINGGNDKDTILLWGLQSEVNGDSGDDSITLLRNSSQSVANGGNDNDTLIDNGTQNTLNGGAGDDTLTGNGDTDPDTTRFATKMFGGAGNDTYNIRSLNESVSELAGEGTDTIRTALATFSMADINDVENLTSTNVPINGFGATLTGNALDNVITGASGDDVLSGGAGNDTLDGGASSDGMTGGTGNDTYIVDIFGDDLVELANEGTDLVKSSASDFILSANIENLELVGTAAAGAGNELANTITGNASANTLFGRAGGDTLIGGAGNDKLLGGEGADSMSGGSGNDTYEVDNVGDTISESANNGTDRVDSSINFTLTSNLENLVLTGTAAKGTGNGSANSITGNAAANTLSGLAGNDILVGDAGNDRIIGGAGKDTMSGGNGADTFDFNAASDSLVLARDFITDFRHGQDKIDLSTIDADSTTAGNQRFKFIGEKYLSGDGGELRFWQKDNAGTADDYTAVRADINGDGKAEFAINLEGLVDLDIRDFIL